LYIYYISKASVLPNHLNLVREIKCTPETDIINPYLNLEPQYKTIYKNKGTQKVVKVKLKDNAEFLIKYLRIKPTNESEINDLVREYRIGNILGAYR